MVRRGRETINKHINKKSINTEKYYKTLSMQKFMREILGVMKIFYILIVVVVTQVYIYFKIQ